MAATAEVRVYADDPDDDLDDLVAGLRRCAGDDAVTHHQSPRLAKADTVESIVLALGSAGVLTAAVEVVRSWLGRDRRRSVAMSWHEDGGLESVTISGDNLDDQSVGAIVDALAKRLDETA
ncbi:MAG TPA: hypothetical protein VFZ77_21315 [Acidimicrobiales bacterium]